MVAAFGWGTLAGSSLVIGALVALRFSLGLGAIGLIMDSDAVLVLSRARRPPLAGWDVLCEETFARQKADWLRERDEMTSGRRKSRLGLMPDA